MEYKTEQDMLIHYEKNMTCGDNLIAQILRDHIKYPINLNQEYNDYLNNFTNPYSLANYIITNNLKQQR